MLSVQTPSCAGMERLGIPARSTLGAPPSTRDDRYDTTNCLKIDKNVVIKYSNYLSEVIEEHFQPYTTIS